MGEKIQVVKFPFYAPFFFQSTSKNRVAVVFQEQLGFEVDSGIQWIIPFERDSLIL